MTQTILNVDEAAELLSIESPTVRKLARQGKIPATKIGREWRFIELDLINHIRAQYPTKKQNGDQSCSISVKAAPIGGSKSNTTNKAYIEALGLKTEAKPKSTTIN